MHRFKRVLSILLASLTVFSSTHVVALAEGIDQLRTDLIAAETGGSVVLSENMEEVEPGDTEADTGSAPETDTGTGSGSAPETDTETDTGSAPETDTEPGTGSAPETDTGTDAGSALETDTETGASSTPEEITGGPNGENSSGTPVGEPEAGSSGSAGDLGDDPTIGDSQGQEESEAPRLVIRWMEEDGGIRLIAVLEHPEEDTAVEVAIRLNAEEASALQQPLPESIAFQALEEGAELRFSLSTESPELSEKLSFVGSAPDLIIAVAEEDISVSFTGVGSDLAEYTFESEELSLAVDGTCDWTVDAEAEEEEILWGNEEAEDMRFLVTLAPTGEEELLLTERQTAEFTITLPEHFAFLDGSTAYDENAHQITLDGSPAVTLEGLGEDCALFDFSLEGVELSFTLERTAADEPLSPLEIAITVHSGAVKAERQEIPALLSLFTNEKETANTFEEEEETFQVVLEVRLTSFPYAGEDYAGETTVTASLSLRSGAFIRQDRYMAAMSGSIFWCDGYEREFRPDSYIPILEFVECDEDDNPIGEWAVPTEEQLAAMDMEELPEVSVNKTANPWTWSVSAGTLPTQVTTGDIFGDLEVRYYQWRVRPVEAVEHYMLREVTKEDIENQTITTVDQAGWYYMLVDDYQFDITLRWGTRGEEGGQPGITNAILEGLELHAAVSGRDESSTLLDMYEDDQLILERDPGENPNHGVFTIQNIPKYNIDNTLITYTVEPKKGGDGIIDSGELPGLAEDERYAITYDNTGTSYGGVTDKVHDGGHIYLTLTGETSFSANKVWLDGSDSSNRPDGVFQLWRYRAGQSYTSAAVVRDANGTILETPLSTKENQKIEFDLDGDGVNDPLPKYDSEGYRYIYVVREYLEGEHAGDYEQVFALVEQNENTGSVTYTDMLPETETGEIKQEKRTTDDRETDDTYVYNGGTISNRRRGTTTATASKTWRAAAFQSELDGVKVEFSLESRPTGEYSDPEVGWIPVADESGTPVTIEMEGFTAEDLAERSETVSISKYGPLGRELEYRWVESGVYQKDENEQYGENLLLEDGSFTLQQDGREIRYRSELVVQEENGGWVTRLENTISNTINYHVEKQWRDMEPEKEITLQLYLIGPDGQIKHPNSGEEKPICEFKLDGEPDAEPMPVIIDGFGSFTVQEGEQGDATEEELRAVWTADLSGLPQYDSEGRSYEYVLLEKTGGSSFPEYVTTRDEEGNYTTTVINGPGEGNQILVRKAWIDDSDDLHREVVTIGVYHNTEKDPETGNPLKIAETTLGDGVWLVEVGIGEYEPKDVFLVEEKLGAAAIDFTGRLENHGQSDEPHQYAEGVYHSYEVTYSKGEELAGMTCYTVTNRRLGNIDITVTKHWGDGDNYGKRIQDALDKIEEGDQPRLVLELQFESQLEGYKIRPSKVGEYDEISLGSDYIPIRDNGGVPNQSANSKTSTAQRDLKFGNQNQKYYFSYLPKYDLEGRVAHYTVVEHWVDQNGEEVNLADLAAKHSDSDAWQELLDVWDEYATTIRETKYTVTELHERDSQEILVTNYRTGSKTVYWEKLWRDTYAYENGQRPDLYLDLYQLTTNPDEEEPLTLYRSNYRWRPTQPQEGSDPGDEYHERWHWFAEFTGLPQYDDEGYEYIYYAIEHTMVDAGEFDYAYARYLVPGETEDLVEIGTVNGSQDGSKVEVKDWMYKIPEGVANDPEDTGKYLLREGGTFLNGLVGTAQIQGDKLWTGLPAGYDRENDLPDVTFTVKQSLNGDVIDENIATLTIKSKEWAGLQSAGRYRFTIQYQGANTVHNIDGDGMISFHPEGTSDTWSPLPKYNEYGRLYTYALSEEVIFAEEDGKTLPEGEVVFETEGNTFSFTNQYSTDENRAEVAVQKHLYLPTDEDGNYVFPAVTFQLSRTYVKNDGSPSDSEIVSTITWSSSDIKAAWDGLTDEKKGGYVTGVLSFGKQEIYAPNGSIYTYTITEVKDNLAGFDTWAAAGNLTAEAVMGNGDQYKHIPTDESPNPQVTGITLKATAEGQDIPTIYATFANKRQGEQQVLTAIQGTKLWKDFGNHFGLRKGNFTDQNAEGSTDKITLTLYCYAESQPGQGNGIDEHEVKITFKGDYYGNTERGPDNDTDTLHSTWYYQFTTTDDTVLEQFAPNGMPWIYVVKEELTGDLEYYSMDTSRVQRSAKDAQNVDGTLTLTLPDLVNSLESTVSYSKTWVDSEGNPITEDVLGYPVTVEFRLDVAEREPGADEGTYTIKDGNNGWKSASEYFDPKNKNIDEEAYIAVFGDGAQPPFNQTLEGYLGAAVWGETQTGPTNLPTAIRKPAEGGEKGEVVRLIYRVVETSIYGTVGGEEVNRIDFKVVPSNDGKTYTYVGYENALFQPVYYPAGLAAGAKEANHSYTRDLYNTLSEVELTVTKRWEGDNNNAYGTRPETEREGYTWQTSFLIQRSTDNTNWEHVYRTEDGSPQPLIVTLYGNNENAEMHEEVPGLPERASDGNPYTYRVRELSAELNWVDTEDETVSAAIADIATEGATSKYVLGADDRYNTAYTVTYEGNTTVVNTLDTTELYASKQWIRDEELTTGVTFQLQYQVSDTEWRDVPALAGTVSLEGTEDDSTGDVSYELEPDADGRWMAVWEGLPLRMPGSKMDEDGKTIYRVVETVADGQGGIYLQEDEQEKYVVDGESYDIWRFVNTQKTSFQVTKSWGLAAGVPPETVTVGIYRTTNQTEVGRKLDVNEVPAASGEGQMTLTFQQAGTQTVNNLPKYDASGKLYYYYALELMIGDAAVPDPSEDFATVGSGSDRYDVYYTWDMDHTTILNIGYQDLTIIKHWKDNSNAYGTRPDNLTLTLYRTPKGGERQKVEIEQPEWIKSDDNTWTLTYTGLPMADKKGKVYNYEVEEVSIPEIPGMGHYEALGPKTVNGEVIFTNTLKDTLDIPVAKVWDDNNDAFGYRPENITLELYANDDEKPVRTQKLSATGLLARLLGKTENTWSCIFEDLPKYDENGKLINYEVREVLESETGERYAVTVYPESADSTTLPEEGFTLTNTGEGRLLITKRVTGSRGDHRKDFTFTVTFTDPAENPLAESFPYEKTLQDGTVQSGEIASGEQFQLKDGESMRIDCLPGGTQYTVTESDNAGYRVTATGATGEIQAGVELTATYENYRGGGGGGGDRDPDPDPHPHRDPDPGDRPHRDPLPDTGLNWTAPALLAGTGIALITAGLLPRRKKKEGDDDAR